MTAVPRENEELLLKSPLPGIGFSDFNEPLDEASSVSPILSLSLLVALCPSTTVVKSFEKETLMCFSR